MKIIKRGKKPEERVYRVTCEYCETVFEFVKKEAKYVSDERDGDALEVKCPVCKKKAWVAAAD